MGLTGECHATFDVNKPTEERVSVEVDKDQAVRRGQRVSVLFERAGAEKGMMVFEGRHDVVQARGAAAVYCAIGVG